MDLAKPKSGALPPFFLFCWHLLICENTLTQVVTIKKRKEKEKKKKIILAGSRTRFDGVISRRLVH